MRLWHKDLIPVLPRQQLLGQWRECCAIARNISVLGKPSQLLVDRIMDYPIEHFITFAWIIAAEMSQRGYNINPKTFTKYYPLRNNSADLRESLFSAWHNKRYLVQCFYNLQEKHDCGGIPDDEWDKLNDLYKHLLQIPE